MQNIWILTKEGICNTLDCNCRNILSVEKLFFDMSSFVTLNESSNFDFLVIVIICENIFYIKSNIILTTRNDIVTSPLKLPAFWEEIQSFSYKIKGPNWRGSNLGNNSNCCCFFHFFVYYNYMTIQKTTVHSGLNNIDTFITRIAQRHIWARLYERNIQRTVLSNRLLVLQVKIY